MRARWRRRFGAVAAALAVSSCAGPQATVVQGIFHAPHRFRVAVPSAEWTVARAGESELELRHPGTRAGILVNAECGTAAAQRDLGVLARRLFLGLRAREVLTNGVSTLGELPAAHSVMEARVSGEDERMRLEAYVAKDERCVYDLVYVAPAASFAQGRPDFQRLVESFVRE